MPFVQRRADRRGRRAHRHDPVRLARRRLSAGGRRGRWSPRARPRSPAKPCIADLHGDRRRPQLSGLARSALTIAALRAWRRRARTRYIGDMMFSPFDPDRLEARRRRFRAIPVRMLLPNLITLLALCAGLTAIRLAFEGKLEWALAAIVFAAALDGIDGRRRAPAQGPVALRRRARQPCRLRQFRLRAGADPLFLGPARSRQRRLDRRHGVRDLRGAAARALQRDDRRSEPAALGRQFLHRRAGAGRRDRRAAADLSQSARRAEVSLRRSRCSTRLRSRS